MDVLLLVHVPPVFTSVKMIVESRHTLAVPPIAAGIGFTVSVIVLPVDSVLIQPATFVKDVTVTVLLPELVRSVPGIVNVPVPPAMTSDAARPVAEFAPLRL
jgi:hypothetical protein